MIKNLSPSDAKKIMDSGEDFNLIDVREMKEYKESHLKGSKLIPLDEIEKKIEKEIPNKDEKLLLYCRSGKRSQFACKVLDKLGYNNIYNIGGIMDWPYEVEK